jgi:hypothetical protein
MVLDRGLVFVDSGQAEVERIGFSRFHHCGNGEEEHDEGGSRDLDLISIGAML